MKIKIRKAIQIVLLSGVLISAFSKTALGIDLEDENQSLITVITTISLDHPLVRELESLFSTDVFSTDFMEEYGMFLSMVEINNENYFYLSHGIAFPVDSDYLLTAAHIVDYLYLVTNQPQMLTNKEELKPILGEGLSTHIMQIGNSNPSPQVLETIEDCLEESIQQNRIDYALKLLIVREMLHQPQENVLSLWCINFNQKASLIDPISIVKDYDADIAVFSCNIDNPAMYYSLGKYESVDEDTDIRLHLRDYINGDNNTIIHPLPVERVKCQYLGEWQNKKKVALVEFRSEGLFKDGWSGAPVVKDDETVIGIIYGNIYDPLLHRRINLITPMEQVIHFLEANNIPYNTEFSVASIQLLYSIPLHLNEPYYDYFLPGYANFQLGFAYNPLEYLSVLFSFSYQYFVTKPDYDHDSYLSTITISVGAGYRWRINHFLSFEAGLLFGWKYKILNTPDFNTESSLNKFVLLPDINLCFLVHEQVGIILNLQYTIEFQQELDHYQTVISPAIGIRYGF